MAQEHLYKTGEKITPHYRAILYKNGSLHLVLECALENKNMYIPISHSKLSTLSEQMESHTVIIFDPELYSFKFPPVAIGLTDSPLVFEYPDRRLLIMPLKIEGNEGKIPNVENFLNWEEWEGAEVEAEVS